MKVLVTGADGFVGRHLVRRLLRAGHEVTGGRRPGGDDGPLSDPTLAGTRWTPLELTDTQAVRRFAAHPADAVVHLAAVSSNPEALADPEEAWQINLMGVVRLLGALAECRSAGTADPTVLLVSSAEVYGGADARPRREDDPPAPRSPYAASKAAAEIAGLEVWRRTGLRVIVARPFQHSGPGQSARFVVPALMARLRAARASGARTIPTGSLAPVRDLLDVRDVAAAYELLLERGAPGTVYNVASGEGIELREVFRRLAGLIGVDAEPMVDPALARATDIPHLVGDPGRLRETTGWAPVHTLDDMLRDTVNAEAH
jgi:GDP-4-dehydro-6-deoxy-D-mannose reductase